MKRALWMAAAVTLAAACLPTGAGASRNGFAYSSDSNGFGYLLIEPGGNMSGSSDSDWWEDARREVSGFDRPVLWLRLDRRDYVVADRATVARAREILRQVQELGERQGRLGNRQGELGRQQARLGARQAELGARQAQLSVRMSSRIGRDEMSESEQRSLERQMDDLSRQQEYLSHLQEPLARRQNELGARQSAMGREQERVSARAQDALRRLAEDAVESGRATRAQ